MLVRLVSDSRPQVICLPRPPKVLGLQAWTTAPGQKILFLAFSSFCFVCLFFRQGLAMPPRLESSSATSAHCNLHLLDSSNSPAWTSWIAGATGTCHHAWLIFVFLVEMGFLRVGQAGLELPTSGDPPTLASQSAGITGSIHRTQPYFLISILNIYFL